MRLALLELSLEQVGLGGMLYLRFLVNESPLGEALRTGQIVPQVPIHATDFIRYLGQHLPTLNDAAIEKASWRHEPLLSEFEFVLTALDMLIPEVFDRKYPFPQSVKREPVHYRFGLGVFRGSPLGRWLVRGFRKVKSELDSLGIRTLDQTIKNASLYARLDPASGRIRLPEMDQKLARLLDTASHAVENFIRGLMKGYERDKALRQRVWDKPPK